MRYLTLTVVLAAALTALTFGARPCSAQSDTKYTKPAKTDVPVEFNVDAATKKRLEDMYSIASLWGVGTFQEKVQSALDQLVAMGEPAVRFVLAEKIDTIDSLQTRVIDEVIKKMPDVSARLMLKQLPLEKRMYAKANLIRLLGEMKVRDAIPLITPFLSETGRLQRVSIYALGEIRDPSALPLLTPLLTNDNELVRLNTALALGKIGTDGAVDPLLQALNDKVYDVRYPAANSLRLIASVSLPKVLAYLTECRTLEGAQKLYPGLTPHRLFLVQTLLMMTAAQIATDSLAPPATAQPVQPQPTEPVVSLSPATVGEVIKGIARYLNADEWQVRRVAVESLASIPSPQAKAVVLALRPEAESDLFVRAYISDTQEKLAKEAKQ